MTSTRSSRFPRRSLSRRFAAAGAAWLVAGPILAAARPAEAAPLAYAPAREAHGSQSQSAGAYLTAASPPAPTSYTLAWTAARPPVSPPSLVNAAAAYDGDTSTVVLFGGVTAGGSLSDNTWVWDGQSWTEHPASSMTQAPPARQDASMAFDPSLHQLILFGGQGAGGTLLGDTWAWNGASWYQLPPGPYGGPGARRDAALALGPNGNLVLFGGLGPPAAAAPSTTTTTAPAPQATTPASTPRTTAAAERVLGDTWEWTSGGWAPTSATGPSPRWGAAEAYDSTDHTTVLFSGDTADPTASARLASGTWTWDGTRWSRQTPTSSPPPRFEAVMADDPAAGGTVLVTGNDGSGVLADGWIWTGSAWEQAGGRGSAGRSGAAGAYDSSRSTLVLFAGAGAGGASLDDTELVSTLKAQSTPPTTTAPTTTTTRPSGSSTVPSSPTTRPTGSSPTTASGRPTSSPSTTPDRQPSTSPSSDVASPGPSALALQTSIHNVRQGGTVHLAGSGFAPGTTVTITFHSTPALVGRSVAGPSGAFSATVSIPRSAKPGEHHFVATGVTPQGRPTTLLASVFVMAPPAHKGVSLAVKLAMIGLALLIPAAAWMAMTGANRWRRRPGSSQT